MDISITNLVNPMVLDIWLTACYCRFTENISSKKGFEHAWVIQMNLDKYTSLHICQIQSGRDVCTRSVFSAATFELKSSRIQLGKLKASENLYALTNSRAGGRTHANNLFWSIIIACGRRKRKIIPPLMQKFRKNSVTIINIQEKPPWHAFIKWQHVCVYHKLLCLAITAVTLEVWTCSSTIF